MTLLLKQVFQFIALLNSEKGTNQIAAGIAVGFILGMTPAFSLQSILIILCLLFFRIQIAAALLATFFFAFAAYLLDPVFHRVGKSVLEISSLQASFTSLYNLPILPFTRFNNTVVMGSGIVAILLSPFVFFIAKYLVAAYRVQVVAKVKQTKAFKALQTTKLFKWYYKYEQYEW